MCMNTITETQQESNCKQETGKFNPLAGGLKASTAPLGFVSDESHLYFVNGDAELSQVVDEIMSCISNVSRFIEAKLDQGIRNPGRAMASLEYYEVKLLLSRLDQASGLCLSVSNAVEDIEEFLR